MESSRRGFDFFVSPPEPPIYTSHFLVNTSTVSVFSDDGGEKLASTSYAEGEDTAAVLAKLCQENGLTGNYLAVFSTLFGSPKRTAFFVAEVKNPPVEITFE